MYEKPPNCTLLRSERYGVPSRKQTHLKVFWCFHSRGSSRARGLSEPTHGAVRTLGPGLRTSTRTPPYAPNARSGPRSLLLRVTAFSQGLPGLQSGVHGSFLTCADVSRAPPGRGSKHRPQPQGPQAGGRGEALRRHVTARTRQPRRRPAAPSRGHRPPASRPPYARNHLGQEVVPPRPAALCASPRPSLRTCAPRGRPSLRKHFLWAP